MCCLHISASIQMDNNYDSVDFIARNVKFVERFVIMCLDCEMSIEMYVEIVMIFVYSLWKNLFSIRVYLLLFNQWLLSFNKKVIKLIVANKTLKKASILTINSVMLARMRRKTSISRVQQQRNGKQNRSNWLIYIITVIASRI